MVVINIVLIYIVLHNMLRTDQGRIARVCHPQDEVPIKVNVSKQIRSLTIMSNILQISFLKVTQKIYTLGQSDFVHLQNGLKLKSLQHLNLDF